MASPAINFLTSWVTMPTFPSLPWRAAHGVAVPEEILRTNFLPQVARGAGIVGHDPILGIFDMRRAWAWKKKGSLG